MKYYITADIHGFYTPFYQALQTAGWFEEKEPHKLIILGDLMDRGREALKLQAFVLKLMETDSVILIRGNHEDLFEDFLLKDRGQPYGYHLSNGTLETAVQLTSSMDGGGWNGVGSEEFVKACIQTPFYQIIMPAMVDYFETQNNIFVHGWIPSIKTAVGIEPLPNWRNTSLKRWKEARWINGMDAAEHYKGDKTVYCGHWHASFGHHRIGNGPEFGEGAVFTPFYGNHIVAVDACTAYSGKVNCIIVEDDAL